MIGYSSENKGVWYIPPEDKVENETTENLVVYRSYIVHAI